MELLSFHGITAEEEAQLRWIINETTVIPLNSTVEDIAIQFRRATRCKLPDAVVAASAVAVGATLVTND
jgi:predicted nucleic acid-binding protein